VPAYVQLADLYRARRDEARAEEMLQRALVRNPQSGLAHHALGLSLIRQHKLEAALGELGRAAELEPDSARFGYVYAVALEQTGRRPEALRTLDAVLTRPLRSRLPVGSGDLGDAARRGVDRPRPSADDPRPAARRSRHRAADRTAAPTRR
jgi:tetratricopeptide (TPR) repeat protein